MRGINPEAFRFALAQIKDGNIFENFGLDFMSKVLGYEFLPAGGIRDRGIDGLEHTFHRHGVERTIYQLSIEKDYKGKIRDSIEKLKKNKIKFNRFIYVTNKDVEFMDLLIDELVAKYRLHIAIYDGKWFAMHVNDSATTIQSFHVFVESHLHEFNRPGKSYEVANLEGDPRLYIFLRQRLDEERNETRLDNIIIDTLILYALEETNPDQGRLMTREEIIEQIKKVVKFDPRVANNLINQRLKVLSEKPRRIHYHTSENAYGLDYEERLAIQNRNLSDASLDKEFEEDTKKSVERNVPSELSTKIDFYLIIRAVLQTLFYQQGVEFANFILTSLSQEVFEKSLPEIVSQVVDETKVPSDIQRVKTYMLTIIRDIVYNGTRRQNEFLNRLSHTYLMLFLLQCDPKICTYFATLAGKLKIYVGSSIIVPALSERFLSEENRRYTNLLLGARKAGVTLLINEAILKEIAGHLRTVKNRYEELYEQNEDLYEDEATIFYISEIIIRAYFYAKTRRQVKNFDEFIGTFVSPSMYRLEDNLVELLKSEFDIDFVTNTSMGIHLASEEVERIVQKLVRYKKIRSGRGAEKRARYDSTVILTIHALRNRNNESGTAGIFGYKTWWLTSDITTQMAAADTDGSKYTASCYMRPDFLYNYISLAPKKGEIDETFKEMFPTLLGINVSWQLPEEVATTIQKYIKEHKEKNPTRVKSDLRELSDELKQFPSYQLTERAKEFFSKKSNI